jgi:Cd2+/Zn2+-exporting ATPase
MSQNNGRTYLVSGVCCSTEEAVLRKALDRSLGTGRYNFNPVSCELRVDDPVAGEGVIRTLRAAGFQGKPREDAGPGDSFLDRHGDGITAAIAAGLFLLAVLGAEGTASRVLLGAAILAGGHRTFRRAFGSIRTGALDMNVLISVAVAGSLAIGKWEEGAAVVVLFAVSLMLESYSGTRTRRALRSLMSLSPATAAVERDGRETLTPARDVRPGEIILVRPGERVPLDGILIEGRSTLDEAPITGESAHVVKETGDTVYAGSLNGTHALRLRTTREAGESTIAHIVLLVREAQERRAPVQESVDRFARVYTPAVLVLALLVAVLPPLVLGAPALTWLYRSLVLLVIACPCALVIATPVAFVSAMTNAARSGVLIKGGIHLETLAALSTLALDKTGTLTTGSASVTDVVSLDSRTRGQVLATVAALEKDSEHHLASAALRAAERDASGEALPVVEEFEALPGRGVRGMIDGTPYYLGNRALSREAGFLTPEVERALKRFEDEGKTSVVLGAGGVPLGVVAFRDGVRHGGRGVIERLRRDGIRRVVMLSGDNDAPARAVGADLGITDVRAGLLPADKVREIEQLKREGGTVGMVGDGINDAPALAAANAGIAMGITGSDAALDTADVVLMSDNLSHLPYLFGLSRSTLRIVRQNIALALFVKLVVCGLALAGSATLWTAVLADDGAALAVILNALRVLAYRDTA